ncbi:molybdate ABC transporter substrate-binding protein [Yoonia sp.]|uniref:molybdate ABC transporter substrate-binding protein n=1 Tax=Yoonia sp. TaxID=2212373 RepID=UPI002FDB4517
MRRFILTIVFLLVPLMARAEVLVFAAASLKEPLDRIAAEFGDVTVSYGGSGAQARQVLLGAPADVVLLANEAWMTALQDAQAVQPESVADFASNRLVFVGPAGSAPLDLTREAIDARRGGGRIATGLTEAVPAGIYAKAALQSLDLWDAFAPHLAEVDNVRAALALVARGQAPLGIVYRTDVRVTPEVTEVAAFPETAHPPIRYTAAVTRDAKDAAADFLAYLLGPEGQDILAEYGFLPPVVAVD